jgi:hypothetical protein
MTYPPAKGKAANSGCRNNPGRHRQPESVGGVIYFAPEIATSYPNRIVCCIHPDIFYTREIYHQAAVTNAESPAIMTSSANSDQHIVVSAEINCPYYIGSVDTPGNHAGLFIDHAVVHLTAFVITLVLRLYQLAPQLLFKIVDYFFHNVIFKLIADVRLSLMYSQN